MPTRGLWLLGTPALTANRADTRVSRRRVMALLAYLAATNRVQTRDGLAGLLWPEADRETVRSVPELGLREDVLAFRG